jgi:hypothetical protein
MRRNFEDPSTEEELDSALRFLKLGKAGGKTGILPELITFGGPNSQSRMLDVMKSVWKNQGVVSDWKNAEIIPIPKKGDLHQCNN